MAVLEVAPEGLDGVVVGGVEPVMDLTAGLALLYRDGRDTEVVPE